MKVKNILGCAAIAVGSAVAAAGLTCALVAPPTATP